MRRRDREITDPLVMMDIMDRCDCVRLGLTDGNEAYIVPLNFGWSGDPEKGFRLYVHGAKEGRKIELLKKDPAVTFEMDTDHGLIEKEDGCSFSFHYSSIMGMGRARFAEGEEKADGLMQMIRHYTGRSDVPLSDKVMDHTSLIVIEVTDWTCKRR
ncbi:MAG: pyridoxamine 5'-phosphate oxidase family protein [Lachnospiraceae bacterium]|nr:pyridoxamine 5'-phosphate oxidase family protein [Lachnospiraceae bacterium]